MKANELRIGNYIEWNNIILSITCCNIDYVIAYDKSKNELIHDLSNVKMFNPIPITEEWLLKFGFEKGKKINGYYFEDGWLCTTYTEGDGGVHYIAEIQYVHQLQNLYFALTGEELTISE